jgi:hypothetical protein
VSIIIAAVMSMVIGILNFSAKLSASKIQTRLLEARSVKTWGEYLEKVKGILQSIDECAKEVKDIQTSILVSDQNCTGVDN